MNDSDEDLDSMRESAKKSRWHTMVREKAWEIEQTLCGIGKG